MGGVGGLVVLAALAASLASAAPARPTIPRSFHALAHYMYNSEDMICSYSTDCASEQPWRIVQDDAAGRLGLASGVQNKYAPVEYAGTPAEWFNMTTIYAGPDTFLLLNTLCYLQQGPIPKTDDADEQNAATEEADADAVTATSSSNRPVAKLRRAAEAGGVARKKHSSEDQTDDAFSGLFDWVAGAEYVGEAPCAAGTCQVWTSKSMAATQMLYADGDRPVAYEVLYGAAVNITYAFLTFDEGAPGDAAWASVFEAFTTEACFDAPPCAPLEVSDGEPFVMKTETLYVFHPENEFDIAGQDIGDALGDAFFVCETLETGMGDNNYAWISKWVLEYDATVIGQYLNCNGYPSSCMGFNDYHIGKEAALGLGFPTAGQCADNTLTGNWLSLPVGGMCSCSDCGVAPASDDLVLGVNCTWSATRVKTIDGECLIKDRDYLGACAVDGRAPFNAAAAALVAAFEDDDSGCTALDVGAPVTLEDTTTTSGRLGRTTA